jgi:hypothetical protein
MNQPSRLPVAGITVGDIPAVGEPADAILAKLGLLKKART